MRKSKEKVKLEKPIWRDYQTGAFKALFREGREEIHRTLRASAMTNVEYNAVMKRFDEMAAQACATIADTMVKLDKIA